MIDENGSINSDWASGDKGICIGFCLGLEPETISDSWETILANPNYATDYSIGDTKYLDLGTEGPALMEIVAFNEDNRADGNGKAGITWISKNTLKTKQKMKQYSSDADLDWKDTPYLRSYLKNTIKPLIPSAVRNAIVPVSKISSTYSNGIVVNGSTTTEDVWIPSAYEITGNTTYESSGPIYTTRFNDMNSRIKYNSGEKTNWRLRSRHSNTDFCVINMYGNLSTSFNNTTMTNINLCFCTN